MDAEANTPEAEELELLATLVELYEDEHYTMDTPEPIDAIKFRMEQLGPQPTRFSALYWQQEQSL